MLKNRRYVKVVMAMMLSVTLLCAMCLPTHAVVWRNMVNYYDTANDLYYESWVDSSVNEGTVFAVRAGTYACPIDYVESIYPSVSVYVRIEVYRGGEKIHEDENEVEDDLGVGVVNAVEVEIPWYVPDSTQPFDYVTTIHKVSTASGIVWSQIRVFGYNDLLGN